MTKEERDVCNRCGAEYCDILGIGCCGKCFYGHTDRAEPAADQETLSLRTRIQKLEEALRKIEQMSDPGSPEKGIIYMKSIAGKALKE